MTLNQAPVFEPVQHSNQVSVFSLPNMNGPDAHPGEETENANLASIIKSIINAGGDYRLDTSIQSFDDPNLAAKLNASGFFFMTDMESVVPANPAFLPAAAKTTLESWVSNGGVIMMTGTFGNFDVKFLNSIFGWDLTSSSASNWSLNAANASGTPFAGGPATLSNLSATDSIGKGTVANFKTIYGTDDNATVAVISHGAGSVIFLGFDYYDAGIAGTGFQTEAPQYLQDVVTGSSSTNAWVTEMIPRAMEYSAQLSSSFILSQGNGSLERSGTLTVSDADSDVVTVTATAIAAVYKDSHGSVISPAGNQPGDSALLAMMQLTPTPVLDGTQVQGSLSWAFDSGNENFKYLKAGEQLVLTYTLTAEDSNGASTDTTLELVINGSNDLPTIEHVPAQRQVVTAGKAAALDNFTVQDADGTPLTVSLSSADGEIGGLSGWAHSGNVWTNTATQDELNAALAAATFKATKAGQASISISVTDESATVVTTHYDLTVNKAPATATNTTVDGMTLTTSTTLLPGGSLGQTVTVPVVTADRVEDSGTVNMADIPLAGTALVARVPTGFGLTAQGGLSHPAGDSISELIEAIKSASAGNGSDDQAHLTGNGSAFLAALATDASLLIQTVTPVVAGSTAPLAPLVISGSAASGQHTALVIDASHLPTGSAIQLENIDFASVIGAVTVAGSQSGQVLSGDASSQTFIVSDTSASHVFAGGGNDTIQLQSATGGGAGSSSLIHGGSDSDTVVFDGARSDYVIEQKDGSTLVSRADDPTHSQTLVNIENLQFSDGTAHIENRSELSLLAGLYESILGRQADVNGFEYWGNQQQTGTLNMGQIALSMAASAENASGGKVFTGDAANDIEVLYQSLFKRASDADGKAFWLAQMHDHGWSLQDVASSFVASVEMSGHAQSATHWDFVA